MTLVYILGTSLSAGGPPTPGDPQPVLGRDDPAGDGAGGQTGHSKLVLYLTMERLLNTLCLVFFSIKQYKITYSQYCRFLIEVDWVHNNENLLVLVCQARISLFESCLAVILNPTMLPQEGGG